MTLNELVILRICGEIHVKVAHFLIFLSFDPVVVQPALGYHITNSQSRYITPTCLKSAQYSLHNNAPTSRKLLKMDVLTYEIC